MARIRTQRRIVTVILLTAAVLVFFTSFFIAGEEIRTGLRIAAAAFASGGAISRLFKGKFGYKPTLEEIEGQRRQVRENM